MTERTATCPACHAVFRVTPEQLLQRGGLVRCGDCREVFDAFSALDAAAGATQPSAAPAAPITPHDAPARAKPATARPSGAWWAGIVLLSLTLALQGAYAHRDSLAQSHPAMRSAVDVACRLLDCNTGPAIQPGALALEDTELIEMPGRPGHVSLQATIRNSADVPQPFPLLELTLRDATGSREIRRVLRPAEYLGVDGAPRAAVTRSGQAFINVRLEVKAFKPTGYVLTLLRP